MGNFGGGGANSFKDSLSARHAFIGFLAKVQRLEATFNSLTNHV